jgi:hypothetical protein
LLIVDENTHGNGKKKLCGCDLKSPYAFVGSDPSDEVV